MPTRYPITRFGVWQVEEDIANFLLIRGKYAYLGNGWTGCGHFYQYLLRHLQHHSSVASRICLE